MNYLQFYDYPFKECFYIALRINFNFTRFYKGSLKFKVKG